MGYCTTGAPKVKCEAGVSCEVGIRNEAGVMDETGVRVAKCRSVGHFWHELERW